MFLNRRAWYQLYRAVRGSPGICHFSFLSSFHESFSTAGPGINYTGPREILLEFVILVF